MQLSHNFSGLALFLLALISAGKATPLAAPGENEITTASTVSAEEPTPYIVSHEEMMHWLATTDAKVTYVGEPLNPLTPRSVQNTMVTYCTTRIDNICGGTCTVYTGGAICLSTPGTNCLAATHNVGFCSRSGCTGSCSQLASCGTPIGDDFCYTPGTESILVTPI